MIKKYKNYIIFGVIIAVLLGAYFMVNMIDTTEKNDTDGQTSEISADNVLEINSDDIAEISIKNETGEYTFVYGDDVTVKGKENIQIDKDKIKNLRLEIATLRAENIVSEHAENFSDFGLDNFKAYLKIVEKNGTENTVYLGNESPVGNGYYAVKNKESKVYILSGYDSNIIFRKLDYYRNTVLFDIVIDDITSLGYEKNDGTKVSFKRNEVPKEDVPHNIFTSYNMVAPFDWAAESSEVSKIIEPFVNFNISEYVADDSTNIAEYGFNPWYARVFIEQKEGNDYNILLGKSKDGKIYLKLSDKKEVYATDATGFVFLDSEPNAYLQNFAYLKSIDTVKKIVYNYNDNVKSEFEVKKVGDEEHDIRKDGKNISQSDFKKMYTELISISIGGDVNYTPSGTPVLTYEFHFIDGTKDIVNYYQYDDRKMALAINGEVQFYVNKTEFDSRVKVINEMINKF